MKKYNLVGVDGNAFAVMGYVMRAMRQCGKSRDEIAKYQNEATSSDYDHLLGVSIDMIEECNDKANEALEEECCF